jgi:putative sterol carrier protein
MSDHARPPEDISPHAFFTRWIPDSVAEDPSRRDRLGDTEAIITFVLAGVGGGTFTVIVTRGVVRGEEGRPFDPDLEVRVDLETWRSLNRGDLSAPEALLRRRVRLRGDLLLAIKLHLILG